MLTPDLIILAVENPQQSATFYSELLAIEPKESSEFFCLLEWSQYFRLGLWAKHRIQPEATPNIGGFEVCIPVYTNEEVDRLYEQWQTKGMNILQKPTKMDFGYTFVAESPDRLRLRICNLD